ncbi:MAG TPA: hypothetical protein VN738_05095 [Acidothermaceae bacterium]|nr:hypothetical protein [Acidothermaceae bacterium]
MSEHVFDWSHDHKMKGLRPCRHCGNPTDLKDDAKRASHKVCAELAAERKAASGRRPRADHLLAGVS